MRELRRAGLRLRMLAAWAGGGAGAGGRLRPSPCGWGVGAEWRPMDVVRISASAWCVRSQRYVLGCGLDGR